MINSLRRIMQVAATSAENRHDGATPTNVTSQHNATERTNDKALVFSLSALTKILYSVVVEQKFPPAKNTIFCSKSFFRK